MKQFALMTRAIKMLRSAIYLCEQSPMEITKHTVIQIKSMLFATFWSSLKEESPRV